MRLIRLVLVLGVLAACAAVPAEAAKTILGFSPADGAVLPSSRTTFTIDTQGFNPVAASDNFYVGVSTSFQLKDDGTLANTFGCLFPTTPVDPTSGRYVAGASATSWGYCNLQPGTTYYWQIFLYTVDADKSNGGLLSCSYITCHTKVMTLTVRPLAPDFTVSASPSAVSMNAPGSVGLAVGVSYLDGFNQSVFMNVAGMPSGMSAAWTADAHSVTLTASGAIASGVYVVTVTGTAGTLVKSASVTLTVTNILRPDFVVSVSPVSVAMSAPGSATLIVNVGSVDGFNQLVNMSVTGMPVGMTDDWDTVARTVKLTATRALESGTYQLTITGIAGALTHSASVTVTVTNVPVVKLDTTAPALAAIPTKGRVGQRLLLRFTVSDASGHARINATLARAGSVLLRKTIQASGVRSRKAMSIAWMPRTAGRFVFCVQATDRNSNATRRRCVNVVVRN